MGERTYYIATDPAFAEYMYYVMVTASPEMKGLLNPRELAYFRTHKAMRDFADNETLERRLLLLTRLGRTWTMTIKTDKAEFDQMFKETSNDYHFVKKNVEMVELLKRGDMFIFGSRDMMMYQHLAAVHCHSQMYILNYDYLRAQKMLLGQRDVRRVEKMKDAAEVYDDLSKVISHAITAFRQSVAIAGVSEFRLRILLVLMGFRNRYVKIETISGKVNETQRSTAVTRSLKSMETDGYVYRMPVPKTEWPTSAYIISEKGIEATMNFIKHVKNKAFYEEG